MNTANIDTNFYRLFGTDPSDARRLLSAAMSKGGDYADIFCEHTVSNELSLRDGEVNSVRSNIDFGIGIRVLSGDRTGYAFSESTRMEDLMRAASTAAEIARDSSSKVILPEDCTPVDFYDHYPLPSDSSDWERHTVEEKKEYLLMLRDLIQQASKRVINITGRIGDQQTRILFFNSLGQCFTDMRPMALMSATVVMQEGSRMENFYASKSYRKGFDFLSQELVQALADDVVKGCNRLFEASRPPCGEMPVVMGAGGSGILLHEAIGHSFEADFNRKGTSIFSDRMGKLICNPDINIVDDGTLPFFRGSVNVDDEGVPGQKTYMVRNGVLNSYLHDRISARHYGVAPTGNGRRESFRYMPIPRMRSTYMENGPATEEDLIRSVKKGIYVDNFANGQVQIGAGDFTFYVKSGYMIEDGHLTRPIKDTNIIGNGPEALAAITGVAGNLIVDDSTWTCGKGQYCPVSCGMPSVLVSKLNVGGINE